jgi:malate dehydrogenase (oxaloacetate-decarboxylating)(NADP+)
MFLAAARTLADLVSEEDLSVGSIYPPLQNIRAVSLQIAISVADEAYASSASFLQRPDNLEQYIEDYMYKPNY